jgi:hypothetical protein
MDDERKLRDAAAVLLDAATRLNSAMAEVMYDARPLFKSRWKDRVDEARHLAAQAVEAAADIHREAVFFDAYVHASPERRDETDQEEELWLGVEGIGRRRGKTIRYLAVAGLKRRGRAFQV